MAKFSFLLVLQDILFRQVIFSLISEMKGNIQLLESNAKDVDDLLNEISNLKPDMLMLEESSALTASARLVHLLKVLQGRPIIVISQEHNLLHVIHWQTIQVEQANDLIAFISPA